MSTSVNIAELRRGLSRYLQRVRRGEEILIRDRNVPVAKLVPLTPTADLDPRLLDLAGRGIVQLPKKKLDWTGILAASPLNVPVKKLLNALEEDRAED